ncbi:GDP-D-glucose phosphorylase 1-like [Tigriopus californicus]|uniref:GDP-D-glucose phosphorylase 1-like n=1 Tax=Tigriopus californicus TaxID=6832 RepID=UPI0027DA5F6D|nr:GDP-D-glucose phosphorylase 1-like [Tigriopus californicus]
MFLNQPDVCEYWNSVGFFRLIGEVDMSSKILKSMATTAFEYSTTDLRVSATGNKTRFDELVETRWNQHMDAGHFRYPFSSPEKINERRPQLLTETSIQVAFETMLLSGSSSLRLGFNSLCAYASVNHQHWHMYYLENVKLYLETAEVQPLPATNGRCYELLDYPAPCFAFQMKSVEDIVAVSKSVHLLIEYLIRNDIAHNVFMTRGQNFDRDSKDQVVRVFVWGRESVIGSKDPGAFVIAVCELAGQILIYQEEFFKNVSEADVARKQREATQFVFAKVKNDLCNVFS